MNMPLVSMNRRRRIGGAATPVFSPSALFALAEPGVWYDPSDVANLAWRRNLLTFTEQFDNAVWGTSAATVSANSSLTTAPDGTNTADLLTADGTSASHFIRPGNFWTAGGTFTETIYIKRNTANFAHLLLEGVNAYLQFSLADGTTTFTSAGTTTNFATSVTDVGNGWYRARLTATNTGASAFRVRYYVLNASNNTAAPSETTTASMFIWGAQLELGSVATDYQKITDVNTEVIERFPSATLYQDTAGTTPVTTPGDPVGLALDKSKGLVLGSELVTNGTFDSGTTGWTLDSAGVSQTVSAGELQVTRDSASGSSYQALSVVAGRTYKLSVQARRVAGTGETSLTVRNGPVLTTSTILLNVTGSVTSSSIVTYSALYTAASTATVYLHCGVGTPNGTSGGFDNISVKELPGFHATQATLASRPTYGIVPLGGRRNLLTRTEEFNDAVWTKTNATVTVDAIAAPNSTTTADALFETTATAFHSIPSTSTIATAVNGAAYTFSVYIKANGRTKGFLSVVNGGGFSTFDLTAKTNVFGGNGTNETVTAQTITELANGWFRLSITSSFSGAANVRPVVGINNDAGASSYAGDATKGFYLWGAQLETGSSATAYQRVGSAFDVTEAGVASLSYLSFDGVDDWLVTPTITPGIDRAQVFAGVRKIADTASGTIIAEFSTTASNAGSFFLITSSTAGYGFGSNGTTLRTASTSTPAAPSTNVLTGIGDIAGDVARLRVNGTQVAETLTDQGTGNFLAYPLYIGRRAGTSLPFNGQLYSLLVRFGTNLDAGTITSTETWVNSKTGAYT